ncbi:MAG TPA: ATP-dependent DNA ligase, partial [Solibacterales bacterium]|nr:ATP-dependent DNA ligase [Bryobacterales bacterium]
WDTEDHARSILTGRTQEEIAKDLPAKKRAAASKKPAAKTDLPPGARKAPMPETISAMAATLVTQLPAGPKWKVEIKWDGVRALCFVDKSELRILSRTGNR